MGMVLPIGNLDGVGLTIDVQILKARTVKRSWIYTATSYIATISS